MGSSLQRLEVLLIGLIVLIAGAVIAVIMVLRPPSPSVYLHTTPQPIATSATGWPTRATTQTPSALPIASPTTSALQPTVVVVANNTLPATTLPVSTTETAPGIVMPSPPMVWAILPWLVLLAGLMGGILLGLWIRRHRRMTYTNQSVGQLLATADAITRDNNLKVMQDLAVQGLLTAELAAVARIDLTQPHQQRAASADSSRTAPPDRLAAPRFPAPDIAEASSAAPSQAEPATPPATIAHY